MLIKNDNIAGFLYGIRTLLTSICYDNINRIILHIDMYEFDLSNS